MLFYSIPFQDICFYFTPHLPIMYATTPHTTPSSMFLTLCAIPAIDTVNALTISDPDYIIAGAECLCTAVSGEKANQYRKQM